MSSSETEESPNSSEFECVQQAAVAGDAETQRKKLRPVEKEDIDAIGQFLLDLCHRQVILMRNDWLVRKLTMYVEFNNFLENAPGLRAKFTERYGSINVGSLLYKTRFLVNTERGSEYFKINQLSLVQQRNKKIEALDENRINRDHEETASISVGEAAGGEHVSVTLEYRGTSLQDRNSNFHFTKSSCYICQEKFTVPGKFEEHVSFHGQASDFQSLKSMRKFDTPIFKVTYEQSHSSPEYCFKLESQLNNIVIEKIVLVHDRSMCFLRSQKENNVHWFSANGYQFATYFEYPIVLIFHDKNETESRIIEQHHFMRTADYPLVSYSGTHRFSSEKLLTVKQPLGCYPPRLDVRLALKQSNSVEQQLCKLSPEFDDYMKNGKVLTLNNICQVLSILLQVEDIDNLSGYSGIVQRHVKLTTFGKTYSFKMRGAKNFGSVLRVHDNVMLITESSATHTFNIDTTWELLTGTSKVKSVLGQVQLIFNDSITFTSDGKLLPEQAYMIVFCPMRRQICQQYRALDLLSTLSIKNINRLFFPTSGPTSAMELLSTTTSLELKNESIRADIAQLLAVQHIVRGTNKETPYVINGGPGTGKTTVFVEAIYQLYSTRVDSKILVTADADSTCDEIALRLCELLPLSVDNLALARIYGDTMTDLQRTQIPKSVLEVSNLSGATHIYPDAGVLHNYRIIVCTLEVVGILAMGKFGKTGRGTGIFTHIFIDDVNVVTQPAALVGVLEALATQGQLVIAGDRKQLEPQLRSRPAFALGLGVSFLERLLMRDCYSSNSPAVYMSLTNNYRAHPEIVDMLSRMYYDNGLKSFSSDDANNVTQKWYGSLNPHYPVMFHAVFGTTLRTQHSKSLYNMREIEVVLEYIKDLMYFGIHEEELNQTDIGIITPHCEQARLIQAELNVRRWLQIETGTAERFQGKQKKIIIISFVCSFMPAAEVFNNSRVLNLMLSRAQSLLMLIGNPETLNYNKQLKEIISECAEHGTSLGNVYQKSVGGAVAKKNSNKMDANTAKATPPSTEGNVNKLVAENLKKLSGTKNKTAQKSKSVAQKQKTVAIGGEKPSPPPQPQPQQQKKQQPSMQQQPHVAKKKADNKAQQKGQQHAQLGHPMKKHVKPVSQENAERKNFNKYKNVIREAQPTNDSPSSMDTLFFSLPKAPINNINTHADVVEDFRKMQSEVNMQLNNLELTDANFPGDEAIAASSVKPNNLKQMTRYQNKSADNSNNFIPQQQQMKAQSIMPQIYPSMPQQPTMAQTQLPPEIPVVMQWMNPQMQQQTQYVRTPQLRRQHTIQEHYVGEQQQHHSHKPKKNGDNCTIA